MLKFIKYGIAFVALFVVLFGLVDNACQKSVFADTVGGLLVGICHGLLRLYCIVENGKFLTVNRAKLIFCHVIRMDMVIGLLIGVSKAMVGLCS